ncbi:MAG: methyl-accepting chemotaxis protein [Gallionella sp.]
MKNNQPVTNEEILFHDDDVFVTRTDLKGLITSVNESFCRISGFSEAELLGKNHNIIRHSDMPAWVFDDLWNTLKSGRPWRGVLKNRCKNGAYYWVRATVSPFLNGKEIIGFLSFRKKPTRQEVADAEAFYRAHPNNAPRKNAFILNWFNHLKLKSKIAILVQPVMFVFLIFGTLNIYQQTSNSIINGAKENAKNIAMQVIDNANMMMVTGVITDKSARKLLMSKIIEGQHLVSLKLVRTDQVVKQFGPGLPEEHLIDPLIKSTIEASLKAGKVIAFSQIKTIDGKPMLRVITPYMVSHDFHGTDCMSCHVVKNHSINGASDLMIDLSAHYNRLYSMTRDLIIWQIVFQILIYLIINWAVSRFIVKRINVVCDHLNEIIDGDFTREVDISGTDEIGLMLCATQSTKILIGSIIDEVKIKANEVDKNASFLSSAVESANTVSLSQAEASHTMAAGIEQLSVSIDSVSDNAMEVRDISTDSAQSAESGGATVSMVVDDMNDVCKDVLMASEAVKELGLRSSEINEIVKVIKGIADQTNLLALNAAIEAARAGDQGRGFAVVADEVRKLAEKTTSCTASVGVVVDSFSKGTMDAVNLIAVAVEKVAHGKTLASQAGEAITDISQGASKVLQGVSDMSLSIREQSIVSREIAVQIEKIAQKAEENSASITRVDESAKTLEKLSGSLRLLTDRFKI